MLEDIVIVHRFISKIIFYHTSYIWKNQQQTKNLKIIIYRKTHFSVLHISLIKKETDTKSLFQKLNRNGTKSLFPKVGKCCRLREVVVQPTSATTRTSDESSPNSGGEGKRPSLRSCQNLKKLSKTFCNIILNNSSFCFHH